MQLEPFVCWVQGGGGAMWGPRTAVGQHYCHESGSGVCASRVSALVTPRGRDQPGPQGRAGRRMPCSRSSQDGVTPRLPSVMNLRPASPRLCFQRAALVLVVLLIAGGLFMFTYKSTQFNIEGFALVLGASFIGGIRWTLTQMLLQKAELGEPGPGPPGREEVGRAGLGMMAHPCHLCRTPESHRHHVPPAATHVPGALPSLCRV